MYVRENILHPAHQSCDSWDVRFIKNVSRVEETPCRQDRSRCGRCGVYQSHGTQVTGQRKVTPEGGSWVCDMMQPLHSGVCQGI